VQVTWGDGQCGGDSDVVKDQLTHVLKVQTTGKAFAALKSDGKVAAPTEGEPSGEVIFSVRILQ